MLNMKIIQYNAPLHHDVVFKVIYHVVQFVSSIRYR